MENGRAYNSPNLQRGELVKAVTRGNGQVGEVITNNAKVLKIYH